MPGKVHALAGENGAGKSTLVKILGGIHQPDGGQILKDGKPRSGSSTPADARRQGIAVVHQHPALFPDLRSPRTSSSAASRAAAAWSTGVR